MEPNPGTPVTLPEFDSANDASFIDASDARYAKATPEERIVLLEHPEKHVGVFKRFVRRHGPYNYTEYRLGSDATSPLLCVVPTHGGSLHYDGEWGTERLVACWDASGHAKWYVGPRKMEALTREACVDGLLKVYDGTMGSEHLISQRWPSGEIRLFDGPKDREHLIKIECRDGTKITFRGEQGEEAMLTRTCPEGSTCDYAGPAGEERKTAFTNSLGTERWDFAGPKNKERMVRHVVWTSGDDDKFYDATDTLYDGPRHKERKLFVLYNRSDEASRLHPPEIRYYKGSRGHERLVGIGIVKPSAWCNYAGRTPSGIEKIAVEDLIERQNFEGDKGKERLVSVESEWIGDTLNQAFDIGNRVRHYAGDKGKERLIRICGAEYTEHFRGEAGKEKLFKTVFPNGNVTFPRGEGAPDAKAATGGSTKKKKNKKQQPKPKPKPVPAQETDAEAARRAAVRRRWRSAAWRAVRLERALAEATRANEEAGAQRRAVREQCDAAKAARPERAYTAQGPSHREGAPTWVAGEAPDARDEAKRAAEKDASRAAAAEAKAARRAAIARGLREYLEKARLLRVAEAIGGS
jgi:hypothetical protein